MFQNLDCGPLCDAIETVTEGVEGKDFSHIGMVVKHHDSLKIIEAIGPGVILTSIDDFFARSGDTLEIHHITVGRLQNEFQPLVKQASAYALSQLGEAYDEAFLIENGKWYCSELIYESFKAANNGNEIFKLQAMTFKDPATKEFFPAWVDYYERLGQPIPEGEAGLNPGSISRSDHIEIIF